MPIQNFRFGLTENPDNDRTVQKCKDEDIPPTPMDGPGAANPVFYGYPPFWALPPGAEGWPMMPQFSFMQMVFPPPYVPAAPKEPDE
jgi:hypothetical protein